MHFRIIRIYLLMIFWLIGFPQNSMALDFKAEHASFDPYFEKYSKRYFGPFFDWRWFKSQAIAESGMDPEARSHMGALGIMQLMPTTFGEIQDSRPHFNRIDDPRWNIAAGIFYTRLLYEQWSEYEEDERMKFTFASYNAGAARVRKVLRETPGTDKSWQYVAPRLPRETRRYVTRIMRIMKTNSQPGKQ